MRRLLAAIVTIGLVLGLASPALAGDRVPSGVKRISVTLTMPLEVGGSQKTVRRTVTGAGTVRGVVRDVDDLQTATTQGPCPMVVRLGPELTVVFRSSSGKTLAETRVQVALGSRGTSGTSACSPITFTAANQNQRLVGNSYIRRVGRLIGTAIS